MKFFTIVLLFTFMCPVTTTAGTVLRRHTPNQNPGLQKLKAIANNPQFQKLARNPQFRNAVFRLIPKPLRQPISWLFARRPIKFNWGPDNIVARPEKMFDMTLWNRNFLSAVWLQGIVHYSVYGDLPETPLWDFLKYKYEVNPDRFIYYHPYFEGLFQPATCIGLLPKGEFWEKLEDKYEINPSRFIYFHPFLEPIMQRNDKPICPPKPPQPPSVPEPSSLILGFVGILFLALCYKL